MASKTIIRLRDRNDNEALKFFCIFITDLLQGWFSYAWTRELGVSYFPLKVPDSAPLVKLAFSQKILDFRAILFDVYFWCNERSRKAVLSEPCSEKNYTTVPSCPDFGCRYVGMIFSPSETKFKMLSRKKKSLKMKLEIRYVAQHPVLPLLTSTNNYNIENAWSTSRSSVFPT